MPSIFISSTMFFWQSWHYIYKIRSIHNFLILLLLLSHNLIRLWIWQGLMVSQAKKMSTQCEETPNNSTRTFITTMFKFESSIETTQSQNMSWGLFWIIYHWRLIKTSQWSKYRWYILDQLIKTNYQETQRTLTDEQEVGFSFLQFDWKPLGT